MSRALTGLSNCDEETSDGRVNARGREEKLRVLSCCCSGVRAIADETRMVAAENAILGCDRCDSVADSSLVWVDPIGRSEVEERINFLSFLCAFF